MAQGRLKRFRGDPMHPGSVLIRENSRRTDKGPQLRLAFAGCAGAEPGAWGFVREYLAQPFLSDLDEYVTLAEISSEPVNGNAGNRKRISRLMDVMGIEAVYPKPKLSQPGQGHRIYPYLLRGVTVERVNQVWSADITYTREPVFPIR